MGFDSFKGLVLQDSRGNAVGLDSLHDGPLVLLFLRHLG
jgi:hypothetical protein